MNIPNRYHQGPARKGQPSVVVALAILGLIAYSHFAKQGIFDNFLNKNGAQQETASKQPVAKSKQLKYVVTLKETRAFAGLDSKESVAVIPQNTELRVLDTQKDQNNNISWLQVKANGLTVWIANDSLKRVD